MWYNEKIYNNDEVLVEICELRKENKYYDKLINSIVERLEVFIDIKNSQVSYTPKSSICYRPKIEVEAIKMTAKEKQFLVEYLNIKYLGKVRGDYFVIKKKNFSNKYKVYTGTQW